MDAGKDMRCSLHLELMEEDEFWTLQDLASRHIGRLCRAKPQNFKAIDACIPTRYLVQCTNSVVHKPLPATAFMAAVRVGHMRSWQPWLP